MKDHHKLLARYLHCGSRQPATHATIVSGSAQSLPSLAGSPLRAMTFLLFVAEIDSQTRTLFSSENPVRGELTNHDCQK